MKVKKFKFYSDAGHGWLAVKRDLLKDMGILGRVSPHSYQRGATVYLEEDDDAALFFKAYERINGRKPEIDVVHVPKHSPIRSYDWFILPLIEDAFPFAVEVATVNVNEHWSLEREIDRRLDDAGIRFAKKNKMGFLGYYTQPKDADKALGIIKAEALPVVVAALGIIKALPV